MKASIGESLGDYTRHEILSTMESESQKIFKENHPKLTPNQLIETMSRKGIKFNLMSREEAKKRITENTYYFKVGVYRHNFIKDENGQYSNLDFAHLDDLAILDMRLRKILLNMSLDLEHSLKTLVNSIVTMDKLEDGYQIVQDFSTTHKFDLSNMYGIYDKRSHYLNPVKNKHSSCTSVWVLLELMSFGELSKFLEFYFDRTKISKKRLVYPAKLIRYAKNVRNAAAHNNPIILNLSGMTSISPDPKIMQTNHKMGLDKSLYRNPRINDILCLFFLHDMYCSKGVRNHLISELEAFKKRCMRNASYYSNNNHLKELYRNLELLIDYYKFK